MPAPNDVQEVVQAVLGPLVQRFEVNSGALIAYIDPQNIRAAALLLRDNPQSEFKHLSYVTAVDRLPDAPRFDVIYELYSHAHKLRVRIKCPLGDSGDASVLPSIDSLAEVFLTANWHERETYDLFGINFTGHPDLRRILLPELWDGYPLRREYPFDGKPAWALGTSVKERPGTAERSLGIEPEPAPAGEGG